MNEGDVWRIIVYGLNNNSEATMRIRYAGVIEARDYPHRIQLLDLHKELKRAGLPALQEVAYGESRSPELRVRFKAQPRRGWSVSIPQEAVRIIVKDWRGRHQALDKKLVFKGLNRFLAKEGYKVRSAIRANGPGTEIAMMVKLQEVV